MGTSIHALHPTANILVSYGHSNSHTDTSAVERIIQRLYGQTPWIVDGVVKSLQCNAMNQRQGTGRGSFAIGIYFEDTTVAGEGQQRAFERLIDRIATGLCAAAPEWPAGVHSFELDVSVSFIASDCVVYRSGLR